MKRILFLLGLVLSFTGTAYADDILKVQKVVIAPGESITLNIELDNETTNLMGWQCDIVLPEGMSLALKSNGKPAATLGERFATTEHSISSIILASGGYRFIGASMEGEVIPGTTGTLFSVTLQADASLSKGLTLSGTVKNIEFNTKDNIRMTMDNVLFDISTGDNERGDVNGDNKVTPADAIMILYYYFGVIQNDFNVKAADLNGDGVITPADAIEALYQYFDAGNGNARAGRHEAEGVREPE